MPVSLLFCEGGPKSADIRVLASLLAGVCVIRPGGSKYGFGQAVRFARLTSGVAAAIAGLRDRDFDADDTPPRYAPRPWRVENETIHLGWYWERTEIENYLIDPVVVGRALGNRASDIRSYETLLRQSAESLAAYTAARTALSLARVRFTPLPNSWGRERGAAKYRFPDQRAMTDCRAEICRIIAGYEMSQTVTETSVLDRFNALLPTCQPGGARFAHFLTFFSGKDLLLAMENDLVRLGLGAPKEFLERVLKGIEQTQEDAWYWLPEWERLRALLQE